jgi:hypothetical protein
MNPNDDPKNGLIMAEGWRKAAGMQPLPDNAPYSDHLCQSLAWFIAICLICPWWVPVLMVGGTVYTAITWQMVKGAMDVTPIAQRLPWWVPTLFIAVPVVIAYVAYVYYKCL